MEYINKSFMLLLTGLLICSVSCALDANEKKEINSFLLSKANSGDVAIYDLIEAAYKDGYNKGLEDSKIPANKKHNFIENVGGFLHRGLLGAAHGVQRQAELDAIKPRPNNYIVNDAYGSKIGSINQE